MSFLSACCAENLKFIAEFLSPLVDVKKIKICSDIPGCYKYELNQWWFVLFPKNDSELKRLLNQLRLLLYINKNVSVRMPLPQFYNWKYKFFIYRKVAGSKLSSMQFFHLPLSFQHRFCVEIAEFMAQMHKLTEQILNEPVVECLNECDTGVPIDKMREFFNHELVMSREERKIALGFLNDCHCVPIEKQKKVFGHFNLLADNIAFNHRKRSLSGIRGFNKCCFGGIYEDFSCLAQECDISIISRIMEEYYRLSGTKLDIVPIAEGAVYQKMIEYYKCPNHKNQKALMSKLQNFIGTGIFRI